MFDTLPTSLSTTDVEARRDAALERLAGATASDSLCSLSRGSVPAVKYHEGAVGALSDLRRELRQAGGDPASALERVRDRWAADAESPGRSGPNWAGYLAGGTDELAGLATTPASAPGPAPAIEGIAHGGPEDTLVRGSRAGLPTAVASVPTASLWPRRRVLTAVGTFPALLVVLLAQAGGWAPSLPLWSAVVVVIAAVSAAVVATYVPVPGAGARPDLGCTSCAAVAGVSVVCAAGLLNSAPHVLTTTVAALALVSFGLVQRLLGQRSCPTA